MRGVQARRTDRYRTLAKVRDHIEFRHVRHSCATHLLAGTFTNGHEIPIEKVSEILGHEDVLTTIRHYASRSVKRLHREFQKGPAPASDTVQIVGSKTTGKTTRNLTIRRNYAKRRPCAHSSAG